MSDRKTEMCSIFDVFRVPNSRTGQVLEAVIDSLVLVDIHNWTLLTHVVRSGRE